MDFIIKQGETGCTITYNGILKDEKVSYIQDKIQQDLKIDIKDQILITKTGYKLSSEEILEKVEQENSFSSTYTKQDQLLKQYYTIYVFNEKNLLLLPDNNKSPRQQNFIEFEMKKMMSDSYDDSIINQILDQKIIEQDFTSSQNFDFGAAQSLNNLNRDIISNEKQLFQNYQSVKEKCMQYINKQKKFDKIVQELDNQTQSADTLLLMVIQKYQISKEKKNEIFKKIKEQQEKNSQTVKKFDESIENVFYQKIKQQLKKIEIHEKLRKGKQKVLLDVYYSYEQMAQWKKNCLCEQDKILNRCDKILQFLKQIKEKIKEERDNQVQNCRQNTKKQYSQFEQTLIENKCKIQQILVLFNEEYKNFRKHLNLFLENKDQDSANFLKTFDQEKFNKKEQEIIFINDSIEKIYKNYEILLKQKQTNESTIAKVYRSLLKQIKELSTFNKDQMRKFNEDIERMEKDFSYLLNPSLLPNAYNSALQEISRRREFNLIFEQEVNSLNSFIELEYEKRNSFIQTYGRILPKDFIPQLSNLTPQISIQNKTDQLLPMIDGYSKEKLQLQYHNSQILEIEKQNKELKDKIDWLKNEVKGQDLLNLLEQERQKNFLFSQRIQEIEIQKEKELKEISNKHSAQIEELNMCIQKTHNYYQNDYQQSEKLMISPLDQAPLFQKDQNVQEQGELAKLHKRIQNLTEIIQQSSKANFNIFQAKNQEKLDKMAELQQKIDNFDHEKLKIQERSDIVESKYNQISVENRKLTSQKEILKEQIKALESEIEHSKKEIHSKLEMIKSKDDMLKSLNELKNSQNHEISELKSKILQYEKKIKIEHAEILNNLNLINKQEQDKLRSKIKTLENDISNKGQELAKVEQKFHEMKFDNNSKMEDITKLQIQFENQQKTSQKLKTDVQEYINKIQNMDIIMQKKSDEIQVLTKSNNNLQNEKNSMHEEIQKIREQYSENQKKFSKIADSLKILETERATLVNSIEKSNFELEKKNIEISNLKKQIITFTDEQKQTLQVFDQKEKNEKKQIMQLNEALSNKKIELNSKNTRIEILEADIENKNREIRSLQDIINEWEQQNQENQSNIQILNEKLEKEINESEILQHELKDIKIINEQLQIESEIQTKRQCEQEQSVKEWEHKYKDLQLIIEQLEEEVASANQKCRELTIQLKELSEKNEQIQNNFDIKIQEIENKQEEIQQLQDQNEQMQGEMMQKNLMIDTLQNRAQIAEDQLNNLLMFSDNNKNIMEELNKQESFYKEELQEKTEDLVRKQKKIDELNEQVQKNIDLQQQCENFSNEKELLIKDLQQKQDQISKMEDHQLQFQEEIKNYKLNLKESEQFSENLKQKYEILQGKYNQENQIYKDLCVEYDNLEKEFDNLTKEYDRLEKGSTQVAINQTILNDSQNTVQEQDIIIPESLKHDKETFTDLEELQSEDIKINQENLILSKQFTQNFKTVLKHLDSETKLFVQGQNDIVEDIIDIQQELQQSELWNQCINFKKIEEGLRMLFVPVHNGIYVPLITGKDDGKKMNKNENFLDLECLDLKSKDYLKNCNLMVIAKIRNKIPKKAKKDDIFRMVQGTEYYLIQIEIPDFILGIDPDNLVITNYL